MSLVSAIKYVITTQWVTQSFHLNQVLNKGSKPKLNPKSGFKPKPRLTLV